MRWHDETREQLLSEGLRSYFEALCAIKEFQDEIAAACVEILSDRIPEIAKALGKDIDAKRIEASPVRPAHQEAWLGALLPRDPAPWDFHLGLYWNVGDLNTGRVRASVSVEIDTKKELEKYLNVCRNAGIRRPPSSYSYSGSYGAEFGEDMQPSDFAVVREKLKELLGEWIQVWSKCGGLTAILGK